MPNQLDGMDARPGAGPAPVGTPTGSWRDVGTPSQAFDGASQASPSMLHNASSRSFFSPGSDAGSSLSPGKKRPGTGRFHQEELSCFRRLPTPSSLYSRKLEVYLDKTGNLRKTMSDSGLHTLPAMRGDFYRYKAEDYLPQEKKDDSMRTEPAPEKPLLLPLEDKTARVLEEIFPRKLPSRAGVEDSESRVAGRALKNKRSATAPGSAVGSLGETTQLPATGPMASVSSNKALPSANRRLVQFRQKIMDKFSTMRSAFEVFSGDAGGAVKELSKKEFSRFLARHFTGLPKEEHDKIFEFLDHDKSGSISLEEFHTAIECAAPVKTIEDLRKKWIALGYASMRQALIAMDLFKDPGRQMTLQEFGLHLSKVGVEEEAEHQNMFNAISDGRSQTVTLEMLSAAISAVSPSLLLEECREKMLKKFGSVTSAFSAIDIDQGESLDIGEFIRFAVPSFKLTSFEAAKVFRLIDIDGSHKISKHEFLSALVLSEPNLYLDEIRRKVRQRFRSVRELIKEDAAQQEAEAADDSRTRASSPSRANTPPRPNSRETTPSRAGRHLKHSSTQQFMQAIETDAAKNKERLSHTPAEYQQILGKAQLSEADTKTLFELVDINRDGKLSAEEFERGMRFFAPSTVLEDLRMACVRKYGGISEAFAALPQERREVNLDVGGLQQILQELGLWTENCMMDLAGVIDIVECHRDGGLTISELVAALQTGMAGTQVRLSPEQRDAKVRQQVKWQMAPFHRSASELRNYVREKIVPGEEHREWWDQRRDSNAGRKPRRDRNIATMAELMASREGVNDDPTLWGRREESKESVSVAYGPMRNGYTKVSTHLSKLDADESGLLNKLQGYFVSAGDAVGSNEGLLSVQQSRYKQFKSCSHHYALLHRPPGGP
eukprot:gb/GFBE01014119.1/.p1 GENE.gb/GFBE01014119.1/~~gb/GFBE01014119.1/.p1  ORF type:complete len:891 (+),score=181.49 gb/GFBE01014119.1/:1-2673(+)